MARSEFRYPYSDPRFLNHLAMRVADLGTSMSATLMPDIDEFIQVCQNSDKYSHLVPEINGMEMPTDPEGKCNFLKAKSMAIVSKIAKKHGIIPFWALRFDYSISQFDSPQIEYFGSRGNFIGDQPTKTFTNPALFSGRDKWHSVYFREVEEQESLRRVKNAIALFIKRGYVVSGLSIKINRHTIRREYYDLEECDGELYADNGQIKVYVNRGNFNFDPDKVPLYDFSAHSEEGGLEGLMQPNVKALK